eukprot:COSAG02_NODE_1939_length_10312_cov_14.320866_3_plen_893_part_00
MSSAPGQTKGLRSDAGHADLAALIREPQNRRCADCRAPDTQWASANLGLFICLECSGVHRALGVHISKVRSITMDSWYPNQVVRMRTIGNERGNQRWEHTLSREEAKRRRPNAGSQRAVRESFIRAKYEQRAWVDPNATTDSSSDEGGEVTSIDETRDDGSSDDDPSVDAWPQPASASAQGNATTAAAAPSHRPSRAAEEDALASMMAELDGMDDEGVLSTHSDDDAVLNPAPSEQGAIKQIIAEDPLVETGLNAWLEDDEGSEVTLSELSHPEPEPESEAEPEAESVPKEPEPAQASTSETSVGTAVRFMVVSDVVVRGGCEKNSVRLGELEEGTVFTAIEIATNRDGQRRLCFKLSEASAALQLDSSDDEEQAAASGATKGWVSLTAGDGTELATELPSKGQVTLAQPKQGIETGGNTAAVSTPAVLYTASSSGAVAEARTAQHARRDVMTEQDTSSSSGTSKHTQDDTKKKHTHKHTHKRKHKRKHKGSSKSGRSKTAQNLDLGDSDNGNPFYLANPNEASWEAASLGKGLASPRTVRLDRRQANGYGLVFNSEGIVTGYGSGNPRDSAAASAGIPRGALIVGVDGVSCSGRDQIVALVKAASKAGRSSVAFVMMPPDGQKDHSYGGGYSGHGSQSISPHATSASSHPYDPTQNQNSYVADHELAQTLSSGLSRAASFVSNSSYAIRAKDKMESTSVGREIGGLFRSISGGHESIGHSGGGSSTGGGGGLVPDSISWETQDSGYHNGGNAAAAIDPSCAWAVAARPGIKARTITLRANPHGGGYGMSLAQDGTIKRYTGSGGSAERAGVPVGSKIVGVNGTPCVSKDTIVSHIRQSAGATQFTMMPPSGGGRQSHGGGGYGGRSAQPQQTLDTFYTSSSSSSGSCSDSD